MFLSWLPYRVLAADEVIREKPDISGTLSNPLNTTDITEVLNRIFDFLIIIGAPLLAILIIIGGFQILTAAGNPEKINTGRKTILYAAIGYAIILCAKGVIYIIKQILGFK